MKSLMELAACKRSETISKLIKEASIEYVFKISCVGF